MTNVQKTAVKRGQKVHQAKPSKAPKMAKMTAERYLAFARVFNNAGRYQTDESLLRALEPLGYASVDDVYAAAKLLRSWRVKQRDGSLPELLYRTRGEVAHFSQFAAVRDELSRYEFNYATLKDYDGIVVSGAQFDSYLNEPTYLALLQWLKYQETVLKRRYALLVLPIAFGAVRTSGGRLEGTFPRQLEGHMVLRDMTWEGVKLAIFRMLPTRLSSYFTPQTLDSLQRDPAQLTIVGAPMLEMAHRPHAGLTAGDQYPKCFMTSMALTKPKYTIDNLGLPSQQGSLAELNHSYGFVVVDFARDGVPFMRDVVDVMGTGNFYDVVKQQGRLVALKVTPNGVKPAYDVVDTAVLPDWHCGFTSPVVRQAYFGESGIMPQLNPGHIMLHDFVNGTSVNPFKARDMLTRIFREHSTLSLIRKELAYPKPLDALLAKLKVWDASFNSLHGELNLAAAELLWMSNAVPDSTLFVLAANHPKWIEDELNSLNWPKDDRNMMLFAEMMLQIMRQKLSKSVSVVNPHELDPVAWFLETFVAEHADALGVDPDRMRYPGRKEAIVRPLTAPRRVSVGGHGDTPRFSGRERQASVVGMPATIGHYHSGYIGRHVRGVGVATPLVQHYVTTAATAWTHSCDLIFKNGQEMMLHPRPDGRWWAY